MCTYYVLHSIYQTNDDLILHLATTLQCTGFCLQWQQRIGASLGNYSNEEITVFFFRFSRLFFFYYGIRFGFVCHERLRVIKFSDAGDLFAQVVMFSLAMDPFNHRLSNVET